MEHFRSRYAALAASWDADDAALAKRLGAAAPPPLPHTGYDRWVAHANNAALGAFAAYDEWVPAFETLFARQAQAGSTAATTASAATAATGTDPGAWPRFFDAVRQLAALPKPERTAALRQLMPTGVATAAQP